MKKENGNNVILTQELYEELLNTTNDKILDLKSNQVNCYNKILANIEDLKQLKSELKQIKTNIKLCKAALRKGNKKLVRINDELHFHTNNITILNDSFISEGDSSINLNLFGAPKTKKI